MRQVDALRGRIGAGGQWLRLGLASATIMAPLLSRWSDLRAAERARVLADEAEARLHDMRGHLNLASLGAKRDPLELVREARAQLGAERSKASTRLWLVGVGVGLVAASAGAYVLVRRRMAQALEEPLMELPAVSVNGNRAYTQTRLPATATAAETAPENPPTTATPIPSVAAAQANGAAAPNEQDQSSPASAEEANAAPFIGNIRTMVYHEAADDDLPAEENRIYFVSEDEARQAGYRRYRDEVAPGAQADETSG
ncbi:MAG TPA: hypothetical protein VKC57_12450 [Ktedonobacterales bacterium]|nr:hypothetical protein [Ktedonobacterales bacterium]